jgi:hypothetical protein
MLDVYVTEFETVFCILQSAVRRGGNANSQAASETGHSAVWGNPRGAKIRICGRDPDVSIGSGREKVREHGSAL